MLSLEDLQRITQEVCIGHDDDDDENVIENLLNSWKIDDDALAMLSAEYSLLVLTEDISPNYPDSLFPENLGKSFSVALMSGFLIGYKARIEVEMEDHATGA